MRSRRVPCTAKGLMGPRASWRIKSSFGDRFSIQGSSHDWDVRHVPTQCKATVSHTQWPVECAPRDHARQVRARVMPQAKDSVEGDLADRGRHGTQNRERCAWRGAIKRTPTEGRQEGKHGTDLQLGHM